MTGRDEPGDEQDGDAATALEVDRDRLELPPAAGRTCPRCGGAVVPIVWGLPTEEANEAFAAGLAVSGGCLVGPSPERYECVRCRHRS